jgi:hypothetical protein
MRDFPKTQFGGRSGVLHLRKQDRQGALVLGENADK